MSETRIGFCGLGTMGAALPLAAMAAQIEAGLVARGHGDVDDSALARAIGEWSGP